MWDNGQVYIWSMVNLSPEASYTFEVLFFIGTIAKSVAFLCTVATNVRRGLTFFRQVAVSLALIATRLDYVVNNFK